MRPKPVEAFPEERPSILFTRQPQSVSSYEQTDEVVVLTHHKLDLVKPMTGHVIEGRMIGPKQRILLSKSIGV